MLVLVVLQRDLVESDLQNYTASAASVWDSDMGGCLKPLHSSVMFSFGFPCALCLCWGVLQRDLVESDVQNEVASDDNFFSFYLG